MAIRQYRALLLGTASGALIVACAAHVFPALAQSATPLPPVTVDKPKAAKPKPKVATKPVAKRASASVASPVTTSDPVPASVPAEVGATGLAVPTTTTMVRGEDIASKRPTSNDAAELIREVPGVSMYQGGAVSGLPAIDGLADDRLRIQSMGLLITSACANHMNPPLSFVDPSMVGSVEVTKGVAPVSKGGDAIGGTIIVEAPLPNFAAPGQAIKTWGQASAFYRSNNHGIGASAIGEMATQNLSIRYDGAWSKADDYHAGGGELVRSTDYEAQNHALTFAARSNSGDLLTIRAAIQAIPYQGFINQWMDMGDSVQNTLGNKALDFSARYRGNLGWALFDVNAYYHDVKHYMNFLDDKGGSTELTGMPMYTHGKDFGYGTKLEIPVSQRDTFRVGNELHVQQYNEWWPPVEGMYPYMCCNTFQNINNGERIRLGTFAEWEAKWTPKWTTLFGVRNDTVWMDTGNVVGYSDMYDGDANAFNAADHSKTDVNFDVTALARYQPDAKSTYEFGYARKTRSPNIYERYAWSQDGSTMVSWFGDLNGYVGDLDLKPEVAHTISFSAAWKGGGKENPWEVKLTPYYTYVKDYIDVNLKSDAYAAWGYNILRFANHDAELYGADISGRAQLLKSDSIGTVSVSGVAGYVKGARIDTGESLYHMMPFNARVALEDKVSLFGGTWTNVVELQAVEAKTDVDTLRKEPATPGYALVNLRSSFSFENVRFDAGVGNVFDKLYYHPLGGRDYFAIRNDEMTPAVASQGRTFYGGITVKF